MGFYHVTWEHSVFPEVLVDKPGAQDQVKDWLQAAPLLDLSLLGVAVVSRWKLTSAAWGCGF